eukprot:TRINITY_DN703_c0_g1_i1.p1 TRINITY_DN703_c0_g1~~TRINITY_DN703_c0_g1_i1.p1  ORF type:complete len:683 (+),score=258.29 TRINITY_DN703_c0_g1_i1:272-2050(+)
MDTTLTGEKATLSGNSKEYQTYLEQQAQPANTVRDPWRPDEKGVWYSAITQQPISASRYLVYPGDGKHVDQVLREMDATHVMKWRPKRNRRTVIVLDSKWGGWHEVQWDGVVIKTIRDKKTPHPEKPETLKGSVFEDDYKALRQKMQEEDREKRLADIARDEAAAKRLPPKDDVNFDGKRLISLVNSSENVVVRAYTVFKFMERKNLVATAVTFNSLLLACVNTCQFELGLNVWRMMLARGGLPDLMAYNSLMSLCNKSGNKAYTFEVYAEMRAFGLEPDRASFTHLLNADKEEGFRIIRETRDEGKVPIPDSILLRILCETEDVENAFVHWKAMSRGRRPPVVEDYNAMLLMCERRNEYSRAVQIFNDMEERSVAPNFLTYNTVMNMMAINGDVEKLHKVQTMMHDRKVTTLVVLSTFQFAGRDTSIVNGVSMDLSVSIDVPTFDSEQDIALSAITQQLVQHLEFNSEYKPNLKGLPTYTLLHLGNEYNQRASLQFHCEKKSLAYLLLKHGKTPGQEKARHLPRVNVNARMCMDCHDLFAAASKTFRVRLECNDNNTLHVFEDGEDLSCLTGWRSGDAINVPGSGQYGGGL